jgi:O-antigen/teichoic acid export membrane protein
MPTSLKEKTVKGIAWNLFERAGNIAVRLVLGVIIARQLSPEDYGLVGMIMIFIAVANTFVDSGFGLAYVQKKEVSNKDADTVFYTNLLASIILYTILWFSAPAIAKFYNQAELINLTRVMGLTIIINSFKLIQVVKLIRTVNFKQKSIVKNITVVCSGIGGVVAAYNGLGVWSLVVQSLLNHFLTTIGFWIATKWRPGNNFSRESFKAMLSFGGWIFASGLLLTVFNNIYILVIGKFFSAAQLGFYTKAQQFQRLASDQISNTIGSVAFPVYSKLQEQKEKLKNAMQKFLKHTIFIIVPIMSILIVIADSFVLELLTQKWAPMIPYLRLLCIVGLLYPIHVVNVQALVAQGKSNLNFKLEIIKNSLRILNIIITYRFGVFYIIVGEVVLSFIAMLINSFYSKKMVNYGLTKQLKDISKSILSGILASGLGYTMTLILNDHLICLFIIPIIILGTYLFLQRFFNKQILFDTFNLKNILFKKNAKQ